MAGNPVSLYESAGAPIFRGHLMYPEPWLYLRIGHRAAPWPFRGEFAHIGPSQWQFGPAQGLLRYGIVLCAALMLLCLIPSPRARPVPARRPTACLRRPEYADADQG